MMRMSELMRMVLISGLLPRRVRCQTASCTADMLPGQGLMLWCHADCGVIVLLKDDHKGSYLLRAAGLQPAGHGHAESSQGALQGAAADPWVTSISAADMAGFRHPWC